MARIFYQNEFKKDERRIILSQNVVIRLLGFINLCGYKTGIEKLKHGYEYGGWLIGKNNDNNDIEFSITTKSNNFTIKDGVFTPDEDKDALDEMLLHLYTEDYDCVAQFHTHPYNKNESSRFYSSPDINYYKNNLNSEKLSKMLKKNITSFGCLLTCADDQNPEINEEDDIAFISYDTKKNEMHYFPNIYVKTYDNKLVRLPSTKKMLYLDQNGKPYRESQITDESKISDKIEIVRTHFYIKNDVEDDSIDLSTKKH